ncbi:MAG TPA: Crp/Fnr family transcriptional regulator [Candidatus Sulfotelmatobacter sp.]|nr:Crp/Fnr family transcriptional regulator [Candidatus Sulfotelmatobacter sp.]
METLKLPLLSTLRRLPLFTDLSERELSLFAGNITREHHEEGNVIFCEGDVCNELLIVEEGSVKIFKSAPNGRQQLIGIERRGSSLGEVAVFDGGRYPASAEAGSPVVLLRLPAERFRTICLQNPGLSLKVFTVLGHRLRHLMRLVEDLSFSTVRSRLIAYLVRLAEENGVEIGSGVQFELRENNEELAARLGTVRELVSRNLGRLHGAGLIEVRRRSVTVPHLKALREEIDSRAAR